MLGKGKYLWRRIRNWEIYDFIIAIHIYLKMWMQFRDDKFWFEISPIYCLDLFFNQLIQFSLIDHHKCTKTECTTWETSSFFPSAWCTKPILPHLFYSCSSSSSTTCFFYPISILAWSPASQIQHHLRKCPFILHRFLILLPFTLQYSFASSRSLSLCNIVYIQMYALFKMKWIWIEGSGRMIKMKELFFLIFRKLITYSMMTVTIDGSNIHVAFSSSIEIRNEINFGRVV